MKMIVICLLLILTGGQINSSRLAALPEVEIPFEILIKDGQLFVPDRNVKLHLYSMEDFKYIKQISRKGEGPGELRKVPRITLYPDCLYLFGMGKCLFFSRDGYFKSEFKINIFGFIEVAPIKENFVGQKIGKNTRNDYNSIDIAIYKYTEDKEFKFKKAVYYFERPPQKIRGGKRDYTVVTDYLGFIVQDDKIYVGDSSRGLFVAVFDSEGKEINRVNLLEVDKIKMTEQYKKELMERAKRQPSYKIIENMYNIIFPEYFPGFYRFAVNNGKVYFLTYLREDDKREMIIADLKSKKFRRTFVPWVENEAYINFSIVNDKFYYIEENDEEDVWELHMVEIK